MPTQARSQPKSPIDHDVLHVARSLAGSLTKNMPHGYSEAELADYVLQCKTATPSEEILRAIMASRHTPALAAYLCRKETEDIAKLTDINTLTSFTPIPLEMLHLVDTSGIPLDGILRKIFFWGFELDDPIYADMAVGPNRLPLSEITFLLHDVTKIAGPKTCQYLADLYERCFENDPSLFSNLLTLSAWADQSPKILAALFYMGIPVSAHDPCPPDYPYPAEFLSYPARFHSAHDRIALEFQYGSLAGILGSKLPVDLREPPIDP